MAQGNFHITPHGPRSVSARCRALLYLTLALASPLLCVTAFAQNGTLDVKPPGSVENAPGALTAQNPASGPALCQALSEDGQPTCGQEAGNPINVTNGNKFQREVDMPALPGVLGLELVRNYNSASSRLSDAPSMFGRGWRLSYDWALRFDHANRNQSIILVRGDGTPIGLVKNRLAQSPTTDPESWRALGPQAGKLVEFRKSLESEYEWTETSGQRYRFNAKGWLVRIEAPTGEFLSIERERKGDITKVTDPQGRSLVMGLLSDEAALRQQRFGGVQTVDTPVGRYQYRYGGVLSTGSNVDPFKLLSRLIAVEHAGITRHYLFEDVKQAALLTGIRVEGAGSDGVMMNQRIATWAYDTMGRAVLSMKGEQEKVTLLFFPRQKHPQGLETGSTLLTNSLGRSTLYRFQIIASKAQLTEVIGPGCASCGPTNVRHEYDPNGRLLQTTYLAPAIATLMRKPVNTAGYANHRFQAGHPLRAIRMSYDALGRPTHRFLVNYFGGRPEAPQALLRLEYAESSLTGPVQGAARGDARGATPYLDKPIIIARPSVVPGQEHRLELTYNEYGQVSTQREVGFDPVEQREISRTTTFDYQRMQGRSVLVRMDGPLPNGPGQSPVDSDITLYQWDSSGDRILAITEPYGFVRQRVFDDAGRMTRSSFEDGVRRLQQEFRYTLDGRHAMGLESASSSGWMLRPVSTITDIATTTHASQNQSPPGKMTQVDELSMLMLAPILEKRDALGRTTQMIDASGRRIARAFDEANRVKSVNDVLGNRSETVFDSEGRPTRAGLYRAGQSDLLRAAYFWHNDAGRPTKRILPDGRIDAWRYAADGRLVEQVNGDDVRSIVLKGPGKLGDALVQQAVDGDLRLHFSPNDDRKGLARLVDDFGRVVKTTLPDHGDKRASYDECNRLIKLTHADQSSVHYQYDVRGRLIRKQYKDSKDIDQAQTLLVYEGALLKTALDPEQSTQTHYDSLGRKTGESVQLKGLTQTFHTSQSRDPKTGLIMQRGLANGQVMDVARDDVAQGATPKALYLRSTVVAWLLKQSRQYLPRQVSERIVPFFPVKTLVENVQIDPLDGLTAFTAGNGLRTARSFDRAGRLTQQVVDKLGTTRYEYQVGPRIRVIVQQQAEGELSSPVQTSPVQTASPIRSEFSYSGFGAVSPKEPSSGGLLKVASNNVDATYKEFTPTHGPSQPEVKRSGATPAGVIARDSLGRLMDDGRHRYSYSSRGQLAELRESRTNKLMASYRYDSQGHRVAKTMYPDDAVPGAPTRTTYFLWQDNLLVAEINEEGKITTQYFYLNVSESAQATHPIPIVKWESEYNNENPSKRDRLLFIHADHRGAPVAMTDAAKSVIWAIEQPGNFWGVAKPSRQLIAMSQQAAGTDQGQDAARTKIILNLRLPGQYYDVESGLHDNFNRTYDPRTGRYLQPDPLGYPDGPDSYLYASGDPVNKVDPLGLYEVDVHYYMTFTLARLAGLSIQQSYVMASASQYIDDNDFTRPLNIGAGGQHRQRLALYHFTQSGYDPAKGEMPPNEFWDFRTKNPNNPQIRNLQDAANYGVGSIDELPPCARIQLFGEYLHTLEDTFGHRDRINAPIDINLGLGHALYGTETDKTYNGTVKFSLYLGAVGDWNLRESRTLEMERTVFAKIQSNFGVEAKKGGFPITFADVESKLSEFNAIQEDESINGGLFIEKRRLLKSLLTDFGLGPIPEYDPKSACELRKGNLSALKDYLGRLPNEQGYEGNLMLPGTILTTPAICRSTRP